MTRTREIAAGAASLIALAALVAGIPAALIIGVGWPLPTQIPTVEAVADALAGRAPIDPDTYLRAIAAVMWAAWAQIAVAVAVEARAATSGRLSRPLPGLALAQTAAAALVTTVALLWPAGPAARAHAAPTVPAALAEPPPAPERDFPEREPAHPRGATAATNVEHHVVRHDSLWDLAERYLGRGERWEELFTLNQGRPQADGETLTRPGLLRPGWTIFIPTSTATGADPDAGAEVTVAPGDTLAELALDHLGSIEARHDLFDANRGRPQDDGRTLRDPDLIRPGWTLRLPGDPPTSSADAGHHATVDDAPPSTTVRPDAPGSDRASTAAAAPVPAAPTVPPASTAVAPIEPALTGARSDSAADDDESAGLGAGIFGLGGAATAAGVALVLARSRRGQQIRRRPGEHFVVGDTAADVDAAIACTDTELIHGVDNLLRSLADHLADAGRVPRPVLVTVDRGHVELLLDRPDPTPPPGWTTGIDARIWRHPLNATPSDPPDRPAPLPALVTLGALDSGGVLLDLEAVGVTAVTGDADGLSALAASFAVELSASPFADVRDVVLVGVDAAPAVTLGATTSGLVDAVRRAQSAADIVAAGLAESGAASSFELRCRAPHEAWPACIVIVHGDAAAREPDAFDRLAALAASGGRGVAVVVVAAHPAGSLRVHVESEELTIERFGLRCRAQLLTPDAAAAVDDAVITAAADPIPMPPGLPTLFDDAPEAQPVDEDASGEDTAERIVVRLLGPVSVDGPVGTLKPQQLAMLAYLAVYPNATGDALRDAVWRGKPPSQERFLNAIHELRRALGAEHLPPSADGRYRLVGVTSDLAYLREHLTEGPDDPIRLRRALDLVSGVPFSYDTRHRRHFTWVDHHNHTSNTERVVGDAAHHLAAIALDDGDAQLAAWAAQQGLLASPANETLTGDLMTAHLAAGDTRTAEHVLAEYERTLDELGLDDSSDLLHDLLAERRAS